MLGWIPVIIIGSFLLGCIVFSCASILQILKSTTKKNTKNFKKVAKRKPLYEN